MRSHFRKRSTSSHAVQDFISYTHGCNQTSTPVLEGSAWLNPCSATTTASRFRQWLRRPPQKERSERVKWRLNVSIPVWVVNLQGLIHANDGSCLPMATRGSSKIPRQPFWVRRCQESAGSRRVVKEGRIFIGGWQPLGTHLWKRMHRLSPSRLSSSLRLGLALSLVDWPSLIALGEEAQQVSWLTMRNHLWIALLSYAFTSLVYDGRDGEPAACIEDPALHDWLQAPGTQVQWWMHGGKQSPCLCRIIQYRWPQ